MRAFLFPGQGSQFLGMGREAYANDTVRDLFNRANDVLNYNLTKIMFDGSEEELRQTHHAQPAIFLVSYSLYRLLVDPGADMAAGHSLGEYTAFTVANTFTFDDALLLLQKRAKAMQSAGTLNQGTMAAIIGLDAASVSNICSRVSKEIGTVQPANFNSPTQTVITGEAAAVTETMKRAKAAGAKMTQLLKVSGAFHSPMMEPVRQKLAKALTRTPIRNADFPVYTNTDAVPVVDAEGIRTSLLQQLTTPVQWTKTIQGMIADGASEFVEVGPGSILQGLVKRISSSVGISVKVSGINDPSQIEKFQGR